uniref:Reverse transcriptase domain-containing protein n=1 Tax=Tanacetum cinerariifolium TaxID=118510 RepID=A0A699I8S5_TANCI|nr:reverse transcriptase domain-containing protein [Tanacetum cinerariifolium]
MPEIKNQMVLATTSLTGFSGETIWPLGQFRLLVTIGDADHSTRAWMNFMIVRSLSPYSGIIGRPGTREIQAAPSTAHRMLKFSVERGIVTIRSAILIPAECTSVITSSAVSKEEVTRPENFKVALHPDFPDQEVAIGETLLAKGRTELCSILKKNLDIFAWQPSDMTGVPRLVAEHRLNIREGYLPVRQKKRGQAPERAKAIQAEVQKLAEAWIMREVYHHDWLSNPVMVKKHDGSWRMAAEGVFLGYVVTPEGIKPCPDKTAAVLQLPSPRTIKKVQSLNGKLASLNRFLSKSTEKSLPLFKTLKKCIKKSDFHWTAEAEQAFKQLKQNLSELPLLVAPKSKEELIVYLSATYGAITNRLRRYFQAHPITIITDQPIKQIMSRLEVAGRLQKWSVMLGEHNITYRPRTLVKGQILADLFYQNAEGNPPVAPVAETQQEPWTLFTNGSSCVDGSGAGLILTSPEGIEFSYALRFQFASSDNEAEYEALIAGLRIAAQMGVQNVHVSVYFKLVANQVLGTYIAKEENMIKYMDKVKSLVSRFTNFSISQVPRSKNKKADALSKITSTSFAYLSKQEGGKKAPHQGPTVRIIRGSSLQAVVPYTMVKMCWTALGGEGPGKVKIFDSHYGLLHEMDRSESSSDNHWQSGIKAHLGERNKNWVEELSHVLWAHRTMIKSSHRDTPFSLTYGTKVVIPAEIGMPTYRTAAVDVVYNDDELRLNLDMLEERRERTAIREAKAKLKMTKYYNARVRGVTFRPYDFVYRSNDTSHAVAGGKLGPKWEGPYEVTNALGDGAYKLRSTDGIVLLRTWNIANLKDVTFESQLTHRFQLQLGLANKVIHVFLSFYS